MLAPVVRDGDGVTWIWAYERNRTPLSPPNRGTLGGEEEMADVREAERSGVAAAAVTMMREMAEESVATPAWLKLVRAAVDRRPLGDAVTQLAPDKTVSHVMTVWAVELEPHMQVVPRDVQIDGVPADRDMRRARKFEWVTLDVFLAGLRALYDRGQFAEAVERAVTRLPVGRSNPTLLPIPQGNVISWRAVTPESDTVLDARAKRFSRPIDAQASAAAVQAARRSSFAHLPSGNVTIHRPNGSRHRTWHKPTDEGVVSVQRGLLLFIGSQRQGDMEWCARARSVPTRCVDTRQPVPCDVDVAGVSAGIIAECRAKQYTYMHSSFMCFSWSAALSLPPGGSPPGTAPLGPYRSARFPRALPWVGQPLLARLQQSDAHMRLTVVCGKLVHDAGGSVTIESPPDCRDPASSWFLSMGGYDSSNQHPVWEDPIMIEYLVYTASELVTRPMCAGGSPYRAFRTVAMNRMAIAGSSEYRALVCTHRNHKQMRGRDANGVWHGEHAERYTAGWCSILDRIHELAWQAREKGTAQSPSSSSSESEDSGGDSDSDSGEDKGGDSSGNAESSTESEEAAVAQPPKQQRLSQQQQHVRQPQSKQQQRQMLQQRPALAGGGTVDQLRATRESSKIVVRHQL